MLYSHLSSVGDEFLDGCTLSYVFFDLLEGNPLPMALGAQGDGTFFLRGLHGGWSNVHDQMLRQMTGARLASDTLRDILLVQMRKTTIVPILQDLADYDRAPNDKRVKKTSLPAEVTR